MVTMWIITKGGFVSLVQHDSDPDFVRARARRFEHLANTFTSLEPDEIIDLGPNCPDYRWHANVSKDEAADVMFEAVMDLDYTSHVKESVTGGDAVFYGAMLGCWRELYALQDRPKPGMVMDQESLLDGTGRWGELDDTPTLGDLGGIVGQIGELADKIRAAARPARPDDDDDDDDDEGWPAGLHVAKWTTGQDSCLICGGDMMTDDEYVTLPEDTEFNEPEGPAHIGCAEDEGWSGTR
jgi:hypothetical protein